MGRLEVTACSCMMGISKYWERKGPLLLSKNRARSSGAAGTATAVLIFVVLWACMPTSTHKVNHSLHFGQLSREGFPMAVSKTFS